MFPLPPAAQRFCFSFFLLFLCFLVVTCCEPLFLLEWSVFSVVFWWSLRSGVFCSALDLFVFCTRLNFVMIGVQPRLAPATSPVYITRRLHRMDSVDLLWTTWFCGLRFKRVMISCVRNSEHSFCRDLFLIWRDLDAPRRAAAGRCCHTFSSAIDCVWFVLFCFPLVLISQTGAEKIIPSFSLAANYFWSVCCKLLWVGLSVVVCLIRQRNANEALSRCLY